MINQSTLKRLSAMAGLTALTVLAGGHFLEVNAQRDPFQKPSFMRVRKQLPPGSTAKTVKPTTPVNYGPPTVEARIEYYKRLRAAAAANGEPLPKVTSVLTLSEIAVTGIFKTPRGYGAMVEATPVKLSYPVYPGDKFFDGQLVAVEENRLIFRRVTKVGDGKFVASVENKPLREYSTKAQIEGTAPVQARPGEATTASAAPSGSAPAVPATSVVGKPSGNPFLSPVDEMERQPVNTASEPANDKAKQSQKKPTKVARNRP